MPLGLVLNYWVSINNNITYAHQGGKYMRPLQAVYMWSYQYATCLFMYTVYSAGSGCPLVTAACERRHQHVSWWPSVALITARRPRPCLAPLPAVGAVWAGMRSSALQTHVCTDRSWSFGGTCPHCIVSSIPLTGLWGPMDAGYGPLLW